MLSVFTIIDKLSSIPHHDRINSAIIIIEILWLLIVSKAYPKLTNCSQTNVPY